MRRGTLKSLDITKGQRFLCAGRRKRQGELRWAQVLETRDGFYRIRFSVDGNDTIQWHHTAVKWWCER